MTKQMTALEKNIMLIKLEELAEYVQRMHCIQPCDQCKHHDNGLCKKWDNMEIPSDVKPKGCDEFEFNPDTCPF